MPDEQPTPDPERGEYAHEGTVLDLVIGNGSLRLWTLHELALETGSQEIAEDAIDNLHAAGLVHKTSDGFIFPTRAAIHSREITR